MATTTIALARFSAGKMARAGLVTLALAGAVAVASPAAADPTGIAVVESLTGNPSGEPDVRLMIIGYSFGDEHINEHLVAAARAGTKIFIVDPLGTDVIDKRNKGAQMFQPPTELFSALRDSIVGASRRPLRNTLHRDPVELKKLVDFLSLKIKWVYDP